MNRYQRIHEQRFLAQRSVGLQQCERNGHVMSLVVDWSLALHNTRALFTCVKCGQRFNLDISKSPARIGLALDHKCPRGEK